MFGFRTYLRFLIFTLILLGNCYHWISPNGRKLTSYPGLIMYVILVKGLQLSFIVFELLKRSQISGEEADGLVTIQPYILFMILIGFSALNIDMIFKSNDVFPILNRLAKHRMMKSITTKCELFSSVLLPLIILGGKQITKDSFSLYVVLLMISVCNTFYATIFLSLGIASRHLINEFYSSIIYNESNEEAFNKRIMKHYGKLVRILNKMFQTGRFGLLFSLGLSILFAIYSILRIWLGDIFYIISLLTTIAIPLVLSLPLHSMNNEVSLYLDKVI